MMRTIEQIDMAYFNRLCSTLDHIVSEARVVFKDDAKWQGRRGGCFCLAFGRSGMPLFDTMQVGLVELGARERAIRGAEEKALRLAKHSTHASSFDSRDEATGQLGGAIRLADDLIFSFDGLFEFADEAVMLVLAEVHYGRSPNESKMAELIAKQSHNPYWYRLKNFVGKLSVA